MNKYGFHESAWEAAKREARRQLIRVARQRDTIAYSDLVTHIHSITIEHHDPRIAHFLGEISEAEDTAGRGLLTAVVTHKTGDKLPGPGFFELAQRRHRDTSDLPRCWATEVARVHDYWEDRQQET